MSQVTPLDRTYPPRNTAGQVTLSTPSVKASVANDSTTTSAQVVLLRKGEGGDHSILHVFNLTAGPAPAAEAILPNQDVDTEYSVLVVNGVTASIRAYISGVEDTVALGGSATATLQATGNASLASIDAKLTNPLPVSAAALPLPSGAATEAKQDAGNTSLASLDSKAPALVSGRVPVDGSGVTQPVSGSVSVSNLPATQPVSGSVSVSNFPSSQAVTGPVTDTQLRATPVPVSGTVTATGPLTDAQLRATPVPVSGTVTATGPLTDTQLRATPVPVSGTITATGPLTDTQLRATAVPVSGTVTATGPLTDTQLRATAVPVSGPLTDTQLRATPVNTTCTASTSAAQYNVGVGSVIGTVVLASNASAKYRKIYNWSTSTAYFLYGTLGSVISAGYATFEILPNQCWEMPSSNGQCEYTGVITANGSGGVVNATEGT